ncbi:GreA/GreB family elongation factor [Pedobacter sp. SYSU D00535]|uniref:GreA/GreB family elongation factor n=1 Tax=Pedobacter sp. SYSU D00535 TaxID=2810308 RepID=UPI001A96E782|nr:GreA/GreB family elongation factor [Pedobacter sp. SYSU D00535]
METTQIVILKKDEEILKTHLAKSQLSDFNKNKLASELENAQIVKDGVLPPDVVCIDSEVEIMAVEGKQKFRFQLVMPAEANMKKNKISVFAPIGIALLGNKVGARVQWEMPNGLQTFEILKVDQKLFERSL